MVSKPITKSIEAFRNVSVFLVSDLRARFLWRLRTEIPHPLLSMFSYCVVVISSGNGLRTVVFHKTHLAKLDQIGAWITHVTISIISHAAVVLISAALLRLTILVASKAVLKDVKLVRVHGSW